jgi:hypothetical protein
MISSAERLRPFGDRVSKTQKDEQQRRQDQDDLVSQHDSKSDRAPADFRSASSGATLAGWALPDVSDATSMKSSAP